MLSQVQFDYYHIELKFECFEYLLKLNLSMSVLNLSKLVWLRWIRVSGVHFYETSVYSIVIFQYQILKYNTHTRLLEFGRELEITSYSCLTNSSHTLMCSNAWSRTSHVLIHAVTRATCYSHFILACEKYRDNFCWASLTQKTIQLKWLSWLNPQDSYTWLYTIVDLVDYIRKFSPHWIPRLHSLKTQLSPKKQ